MPEVLWLCTTGEHPVGIVKKFDELEGRWKYYIGTGNGRDLDADVAMIIAWGQKYYSLDFLLAFAGKEAPQANENRLVERFVTRLKDSFPEADRNNISPSIDYDFFCELVDEVATEMEENHAE